MLYTNVNVFTVSPLLWAYLSWHIQYWHTVQCAFASANIRERREGEREKEEGGNREAPLLPPKRPECTA